MKKVTVLVTGVGGRSVGHQVLHALLIHGDKYRIVATDASPFSYGLYQVDTRYIVPPADADAYVPCINRIIEHENVDVVLPGTEPEVRVLASVVLRCPLIVNPAPVVELCANKQRLYTWLDEHHFIVPKTVQGGYWQKLVEQVGFPIVGKPTEGTGGSRGVAILKDRSEILSFLAETDPEKVVFQEYVGTGEDEYTVGVLVSEDGKLIDSIVLKRKLVGLTRGIARAIAGHQYVLSTGYSQGVLMRQALIQETCEQLALRIGIRGPVNVQLRVDGKRVVIFEVHPRFSGTTSIRADVGFNEPDILIRNFLTHEQFGRIDFRTEVAAIRAFSNIIVPISVLDSVPRP